MSSTPHQRTPSRPREAGVPYASYAQIVRMLLPLTVKTSFYDDAGEALWISDGLEEPELRMHVEALLSRCRNEGPGATPVDYSAGEQGQPIYVFPIRSTSGDLVGALAIVFRDAPANATYRRAETVERLLAPLLEILSYNWRPRIVEPEAPVLHEVENLPPSPADVDGVDREAPLPALLRRTLALATHRLGCAFGTLIGTDKPFTLTHRASPDESDLAIDAAIEAVRAPMLKLMQVRNEALLVNGVGQRDRSPPPHKFLVLPLRASSNRLVGLLMLFRRKQDHDFASSDLDELRRIVAQLAPPVLEQLAPQPEPAAPAQLSSPPAAHTPRRGPPVVAADATPTMEERIRAALCADGFDLYVQRISPLRDAWRPARFEVLVRMQDANRLRTPASFFEAAAAGTLLPELDRWVIRRLLGTLKNHASLVRSGRWEFHINLAAQSLLTERFSEFIVAEVCRSSIPAGLLVFEVAESDALEHQAQMELLGARLRDVGCRIALDNCRGGLATFEPLRKWPVSCVKIDGSIIGRLGSHARLESVVRAVTQLAASKGIETVAERVESGELRDKLIDIGIDYAQGFHFGEPQPLKAVLQ